MSDISGQDVSEILEAVTAGDSKASSELFERVYRELRAIAGRYMALERSDHTLQPTAVVHEAYLRLCGGATQRWENRAHFFAAAAEAMRRILVDHARRKLSLKRGGDPVRVDLPDIADAAGDRIEEFLALDQALGRLGALDERMASVVKLRYYAGLSVEEAAEVLGISTRSVNRSWTSARAWLRREMQRRAT